MNKVLLVGRIVKQAELRNTAEKEIPYTRFTIAVDREDNKGKESEADFVQVVLWGKRAERLVEYLNKGKLVNVIGSLRSGKYEKGDGTIKYYSEVFGEKVYLLDVKGKKEEVSAS